MGERLVGGRLASLAGFLTCLLAGFLAWGGAAAAHGTGTVAWVTTAASVTLPGRDLTPVDLSARSVEPKVDVGILPSAMAFTKDGAALLVVSQGNDMLHEIDPLTDRVTHSVTVGVEPDAVAVAPGGAHDRGIALVANLDSNSVTPVELGTWKARAPIPVGKEPVAIVVSSGTAFVADFGSNLVTPIDLATLQAGRPIAVGAGPETEAVSGSQVLVGNFGDSSLTPIDSATRQPGATVALPVDPTGIVVTSSGATAYISGGASVVPLTVSGLVVGTPIALPGVAQAIALEPDSTTAWVALQAGSIVPVALTARSVGHAIHLGGRPSAIVIAPSH